MFSLVQLRQVLRRLAKTPVFTAVTLITLALGVGATTAIFSVVESVVLKPLNYPGSDQLVGVWLNAPELGFDKVGLGPAFYFIDREQSATLQDIGVYYSDPFNVTGAGEPETLKGLVVTDGTLPILGVKPVLGRPVQPSGLYARFTGNSVALVFVLATEVRWKHIRHRPFDYGQCKAVADHRSSAKGFSFSRRG
jgi:hypothetical protein